MSQGQQPEPRAPLGETASSRVDGPEAVEHGPAELAAIRETTICARKGGITM